jgi:hypothetical protein
MRQTASAHRAGRVVGVRTPVARIAIAVACLSVPAGAQWLDRPAAGVPRDARGMPAMTAPVSRLDGKPDLSGVWQPTPEAVVGGRASRPPGWRRGTCSMSRAIIEIRRFQSASFYSNACRGCVLARNSGWSLKNLRLLSRNH